MVSSLIVALGFVGVFTMMSVSTNAMNNAMLRQKLMVQADQMLDVIETDLANIDSYGMDFAACNPPAQDETERWHVKRYEWCRRLNDEVGLPRPGETRSIIVTDQGGGVRRVSIELGAGGNQIQVLVRRNYDS